MSKRFRLPDIRCNVQSGYPPQANYDRRGQMKRSWKLGVKQRNDGSEGVDIEEGLSWGSIGQLLGYLLGEISEEEQDRLYERLYKAYTHTDRGKPLEEPET